MDQQNRNSAWLVIVAIAVTAILVGSGMYLWQSAKVVQEQKIPRVSEATPTETAPSAPMPKSIQAESKSFPAKLLDNAINGTAIEKSYDFRRGEPDGFTSLSGGNLIFMRKKAMGKLYQNEEYIDSVYAPEHPTDKDVIFISTSMAISRYPEDAKSLNKIYSYNVKTGDIAQLYEENDSRLLRTMGMDGSKLILMYDGLDNSPGPCFSIWADWKSFGYLELADIGEGLKPYTVPDYQIAKGKEEQKKCEAEIGL